MPKDKLLCIAQYDLQKRKKERSSVQTAAIVKIKEPITLFLSLEKPLDKC